MHNFPLRNVDPTELRTRLSKMTDAELQDFGRAMEFLSSPKANSGAPSSKTYLLQLEEARSEWRK
jgi:hypothetical protein